MAKNRNRKQIGKYIKNYAGKDNKCFAFYCAAWMAANQNCLKASSRVKYSQTIENHIRPFWGSVPLSGITSEQVNAFTKLLIQEKKLSIKTVRNILSLFHSIFIYAQKCCGHNFHNVEVIYPREQKKIVRILDEQEEERLMAFLLQGMDDPCKLGVYMAIRTGMRIGEVCALRRCDISFQNKTISICQTVQRLKNPDEEAPGKTSLVIGPPKSDSSFRTLPLMPDLACLCERFWPNAPEHFLLTGTNQCMDPRKLQRRLKSYAKACELNEIHFHTLRHTFATRCVEVGFDVKTLSEILGHSNISITMNQYVHPNLASKRENMERLKTVAFR